MTTIGRCELCGATDTRIVARLVAWRDPAFGPFDHIDLCEDEAACRKRITERGDDWPVLERGERPMTPAAHHAIYCESRDIRPMAPLESCPFRAWHTTQEAR